MEAPSLRVLLVDDDDEDRQLIRLALTDAIEYIIIEEMRSGQELLSWLDHKRSANSSNIVYVILHGLSILLDKAMIPQRILDDPLVNERLKLSCLHATEWRALIRFEIEFRSALAKQHRQQLSHVQFGEFYWREQAILVRQQLEEIKVLHRVNQQKRAVVNERQAQERLLLTDQKLTS